MRICDWSSDVCSSDLALRRPSIFSGMAMLTGLLVTKSSSFWLVLEWSMIIWRANAFTSADLARSTAIWLASISYMSPMAAAGMSKVVAMASFWVEDRKSVVDGKCESVRVNIGVGG